MKNIVMLFALAILISFTTNAQSESCCSSKETKTSLEKSNNLQKTVNTENKLETTTAALIDDKNKSEKQLVGSKVNSKVDCKNENKTSGCCDVKKVKDDNMQTESKEKIKEIQ